MPTIRRGAGTMQPPRPSTASLTRQFAKSGIGSSSNDSSSSGDNSMKKRPATAAMSRRRPLSNATPRLNMSRPSSSTRPKETVKKAASRLGTLYGMNSTSDFPKTRGGMRKKKRPMTAPRQRKIAAKLKAAELQEKEKHRYSFWRYDSSTLNKRVMLNNVNPSPRDPIADEKARRRNLHDVPWTMGYRNKLGSGKRGPPKVEFNAATGEVRVLPAESKGWPLDSSMRQPWGANPGPSHPWQPPLDNVPTGDWPKGPNDPPSPRLHFPWSPPRRGSDVSEPMLGFEGNVHSPGRRKSVLSRTTPQQYFAMKDEEEEALRTSRSRSRESRAGNNRPFPDGVSRQRPMTANASPARRVQFMSSVRKASAKRPTTAAASPMRGRMQPRHAQMLKGKSSRPKSAVHSPHMTGRSNSAPRLLAQKQRGNSATPLRRAGKASPARSGKRPNTALARSASATNITDPSSTLGSEMNRPQTAAIFGGKRVSNILSPGTSMRARPHTAAASFRNMKANRKDGQDRSGIRRRSTKSAPYLRPTTATRTKQLYRTGQWPSGRWKMEPASHFIPMTKKERRKSFHVKHKFDRKSDDPNIVSSSEDEEEGLSDEDENDKSINNMRARARRKREAQMRKRPMVAGQRKPRRRFEQKSLASFTVLRSAPLKKHHVHEVLGKKMAERKRRCEGREMATTWILGHQKFKALSLSRLWKQFKPLALENIEATMLLDQLKRSAAGVDRAENSESTGVQEEIHHANKGGKTNSGEASGIHVVDREPWINEYPKFGNMWISRPQFIHHIRILMSLNETHENLRALNRLFSSFDVDVEDKMNVRELCVVMEALREERKRSVWAGKTDVNPIFEAAAKRFRPREIDSHSILGRISHHL